ncbi:hypothetical protein ACFYSF_00135 [Streptomyces canus]|uniref:5-methylcytosine restriction system specificity protein McrC n=1 Tax=Streptomyces canus TaxID=58343 RepID=UPI00369061C1
MLKPDLVRYLPSPHEGVQRQAVVVDAEFKTKPQRDDLYQMTAYCVRLGLGEGHLVYASGSEGVVEVPVAEGRLRAAAVESFAESADRARTVRAA